MATMEDHLGLARRFQQLIDYLLQRADDFPEAITINAFYKALHLIEAVFSQDRSIKHTHSYDHRQKILKTSPRYHDIYRHYRPLINAQTVAKYSLGFRNYLSTEEVINEILNHRLRKIEELTRKISPAIEKAYPLSDKLPPLPIIRSSSRVPPVDYLAQLYREGVLKPCQAEFETLLNSEPDEETIQDFIEENRVLLLQFAPQMIFWKSPILTKYKTDITIHNNKRELILIELEKPSTRLLTKKSGVAAPLQHAIDQVSDWLQTVDDHKAAALECIGLKLENVTSVRGVVIAGRDDPYPATHIRKLKARDFGRISFFTYDDLLRNLAALMSTVTHQ